MTMYSSGWGDLDKGGDNTVDPPLGGPVGGNPPLDSAIQCIGGLAAIIRRPMATEVRAYSATVRFSGINVFAFELIR